jgi:hypothetical protein
MGIDHPGCYSEPILNDVTIIQYEFIFMGLDRNDEQLQQPADLLSAVGSVPFGAGRLEGGEERLFWLAVQPRVSSEVPHAAIL